MSNKEIATSDLAALLAQADGDYVGAWKKLVKSVGDELTATAKRSTIEDRKARWTDAIEKQDRGILAQINKKMSGYLRTMRAQTIGLNAEPRKMTETEADDLMSEYKDLRDIIEFLSARKDEFIRAAVFAHLDVEAAEAGEEFPEKTSGRVTTTLGLDFCRDALADADPSLDLDALKADLTDEQIGKIFRQKVSYTEVVDHEALLKLVDLETVRKHLVPGAPRTARFTTRATKPATKK